MRKSKVELLKELRRGPQKQQVLNEDAFVAMILGGPPLPTQRAFIEDYVESGESGGWKAAYMGPYGCAKTSTLLCKAWLQALYEPGSQILIARANFNDLKDTTYKRMEEMLGRLPPGTLVERNKDAPMKWTIQPIGGGTEFSTFTFMGLQDGMGGYEFHSAYIDECDELEFTRFEEVFGRCRLKGKSRIVACAFNPTSEDHWLYKACTGKDNKGRPIPGGATLKLFTPQPRENAVNVVPGYYEDLAKRYPPDMVRRLVEGEWGSSYVGQGVYSTEFRRKVHVTPLKYDPYLPLFRFWDFGYRFPICLWAQVTDGGGLRVLREEMGKDVEIRPFAARCKAITAAEFHTTREVVDFGDPAANQRKDTGSTLAHLLQEDILLRSRTSGIDEGIRQVRMLLTRLVDGEPAFLIDPKCTVSVRALEGGYHYPDETKTVASPLKPVKDNYYDHSMDALRYGIINIFGTIHGEGVDLTNLPVSVAN